MMGKISVMIQSWIYPRVRCGMIMVSKDTVQIVFLEFIFYFILMVYSIEITKSVFVQTLDLPI